MPEIFVFAGCNGSGKSTLATTFLASLNPTPEFVNADLIAAQINLNNVDAAAISASRQMITRINLLASQKLNFAFETTLAARSFAPFLRKCRSENYTINLIYVWLNNPQLAIERVARRVAAGGHNIPRDIILRRYQRSIRNLRELYLPIANRFQIYDNSQSQTTLIAYFSDSNQPITIIQPDIWTQIIPNI